MKSLAYIPGSDGSGDASLMTITQVRTAPATSITVNTTAGVPAKFFGTMGTPHTFSDPVTGETITVISEATAVNFAGHIDSGKIEIDAIADGETDLGSKVGDIIVIRPTTQWANNLHDVLAESHDDDGSLKDDIVTAPKIDFATFGDYFKKIHRSLSTTAVGTGGGVVSGGSYSFTAPFDGVCVMYGSVPMRNDSGSVVDATVRFRLNGADITPAANTKLGRTIFSGGTAQLHDTSPWARIPIIKGTTYNLTVYAQTSVNGSSAADGGGHVEYELYEKSYADAVIS